MKWLYVEDGTDAYRISAEGKYGISKSLNLTTITYYEVEMADDKDDIIVISTGANLAHTLSNNLGMQFEAFYANVEDGDNYSQYKIVAGPTLQLKTLPYVRPIIKANVSLVGGDEEVTELDNSSELRFSVVAEAFF